MSNKIFSLSQNIRYGNFFQFVLPKSWGHVSVCIEKNADPINIGLKVKSLFEKD